MSHNSSRKGARDRSKPLVHRASHVRSCVSLIAARIGSTREKLMAHILVRMGVDLNAPESLEALMRAFEYLEGLETIPPGVGN